MSVIGVYLDGKHCLNDYGMYLTNVDIGQPEVQTSYINIPGRNGALDLTESLTGEVRYNDRTVTMTFRSAYGICHKEWDELLSEISTDLHGKRILIQFDDENGYYIGRCEISGTPTAGGIYEIEIKATCEPFKYDTNGATTL